MSQMPPPGHWASHYEDDPATSELITRRVIIPHHNELHDAARGFLDPPYKLSLGRRNTEQLGMHHYTVHMKVGIAKEELAELEDSLQNHRFDIATAPSLKFNRLLNGFFTNLMAAFDNLTQELNLIYDLGLDEKASIFDVLDVISLSIKRVRDERSLPRDRVIRNLSKVLSDQGDRVNLQKISSYRKFINHRKIITSLTSVQATVSMSPDPSPVQNIPQGVTDRPAPSTSGGIRIVPSGSLPRPRGAEAAGSHGWPITIPRARFVLPRVDKLGLLPTETSITDLDSRDIVDICTEFYTWTLEFLGKVYEILTHDFSSLS